MRKSALIATILSTILLSPAVFAQKPEKPKVRTMTIPISIFTKKEMRENKAEEFVQADRIVVKEDKDEQQILSIRSVTNSPLSIALVVQEDLASTFNLQIKEIQQFIRELPQGTRVMVAYARSGSIQTRQRFTTDLDRAASSLRIVAGSQVMAPRSPYDSVSEVLDRFDAVPAGRRAILLFSDGRDSSAGFDLASISQSPDLDRASLKAQRKSVAVYSFYTPTVLTENGNQTLILAAQGALSKFSEQTGGKAFFNGSIAPISYLPFFEDLNVSLSRQFALTYLSTHMKKGYHSVEVHSTNPEVKIGHPKGYYYR